MTFGKMGENSKSIETISPPCVMIKLKNLIARNKN